MKATSIDILGYFLADAEKVLSDAGISYRIIETKPPRNDEIFGELRVIRVRFDDALKCMELTVCRV